MVATLLARQADKVLVALLTVSHADLAAPLRLCTGMPGDDIVSGGNTFTAAPFDIGWPNDDDQVPVAQLVAMNVDRAIGQALESINDPAEVTLQAVLASSPDTIERTAAKFQLRNARWNAIQLTADITRNTISTEPCPKYRITPLHFAALFR
jgi:hypothetical protein